MVYIEWTVTSATLHAAQRPINARKNHTMLHMSRNIRRSMIRLESQVYVASPD
jgi:hypothetical protein